MTHAIRHILLDIEGTTCPVSFVSQVLFPYAQAQLQTYLEQHDKDETLLALTAELQRSWQQETEPEAVALRDELHASSPDQQTKLAPAAVLPYLRWLNRQDRKLTAWKDLQGLIWQEGYNSGAIRADLYADVGPTLRQWHREGLTLSVYSSGSVAAQKLLYGHTQDGDLRPLFSHWFDTRVGIKQEPESYRTILQTLVCEGEEMLFVSDSVDELQAAQQCGIHCRFSDRPGNQPQDPGRFQSIQSLAQINLTAEI